MSRRDGEDGMSKKKRYERAEKRHMAIDKKLMSSMID